MPWSTEDKVACHRRQMSGTTKGRWFKSNRGSQKKRLVSASRFFNELPDGAN